MTAPLFPLPPFVRHSDTSRMAALRAYGFADSKRAIVFNAIDGAAEAGLTDEQGFESLRMNSSTYRPRRCELVDGIEGVVPAGMVVDSGRRRKTRSGSLAAVWVSFRYADTAPSGAITHPSALSGNATGAQARSDLPTAGEERLSE